MQTNIVSNRNSVKEFTVNIKHLHKKYMLIQQMEIVLMPPFNSMPQLLQADNGTSKLHNILVMKNWQVLQDVCSITLPRLEQSQASIILSDPPVYLLLEQIG